jgi:2-polyprenyl-6-methoxyphenol hydroxylase-like FAD-dependent oxidoreductase
MARTAGPIDALVVGAGPTGLTLAAQLHALGATTRIVDRQMDPCTSSARLPSNLARSRYSGDSESQRD